jgi:putative MATE family efflux protein
VDAQQVTSPPPAEPPAAPPPDVARSFWGHVMASLRGAHHDYTKGSLHKAILLLAVPMVLEMAMESAFAVVDIWWVNRIDDGWFGATPTGGAAAAAVGFTESLLTIVFAVSMGLSMAVTALVARRVGEQDLAGASRVASQALGLAIAVGVGLGVPALVFAPDLLALMSDGKANVVATGTGYMRWVLGANVIVTLLFMQNAIFRGAGDPILALKTLFVANAINVVLDPCLIFGLGPFPELGVTGNGVATCIGRSVAVGYQFWALHRGHCRVRVRGFARFDAAPMLEIVKLSLGTIGQFLIATTSWVVLMWMAGRFAEQVAAGFTIGMRILMFALLPAWGLANAAATLVGQNLGAKQPDRAERSVWLTGWYDMAFLAVVTIVMLSLAEPIAHLFTQDPAVQPHAVATLRILATGYVFYGWGMVAMNAFNGAGDTRTPTWITFWCFWVLELGLAGLLAFGLDLGPEGVFWSIPIGESFYAVLAMLLFRRGTWKLVKV